MYVEIEACYLAIECATRRNMGNKNNDLSRFNNTNDIFNEMLEKSENIVPTKAEPKIDNNNNNNNIDMSKKSKKKSNYTKVIFNLDVAKYNEMTEAFNAMGIDNISVGLRMIINEYLQKYSS